MSKKKRIYLASPFFNDEQVRQVRDLESIIENSGCECYSPSRDGIKLEINKSTYEDRENTFKDNVKNIENADIIVANITDLDTGTQWEIGYAKRINKKVILVSYDEDLSNNAISSEDLSVILLDEFKILVLSPDYHISNLVRDELMNRDDITDKLLSNSTSYLSTDKNVKITVSSDYPKIYDTKSYLNYDLVICDIDNRNAIISRIIGSLYDPDDIKVATFTTHDYGVNIMLLHSIACHCKGFNEVIYYINKCINAKRVFSIRDYIEQTDKFE